MYNQEKSIDQLMDQNMNILSQNKFSQYPKMTKQLSKPSCSYKQWKVYKDKPPLCTLPFPYCLENQNLIQSKEQQQKHNKQNSNNFKNLFRFKISNRIQEQDEPKKNNKNCTPFINYEKTPINQYLNYELSQQINIGIKQVQVMAHQIKRLRKKKYKGVDTQKPAKEKGIRIRRSYIKNWKGIYVNDNASIKI